MSGSSASASGVRFDPALYRRYDGRCPRYTSYPTALQFDPSFSAADYRRHALATNTGPDALPLSLYVHIPFCRSLCYYCACNKIVTRNAERVEQYLAALHREIELQAELYDFSRPVEQLHFGGGTPTYLDDEQLAALMAHIASVFNLGSALAAEFSIEVDPRSVTPLRLERLADLGFNRLSLGVQDFEPRVQQAVNRVQSAGDIRALTEHGRRIGFRSVSFDLIYGLPHQDRATFARTLDQVVAIRPDRLAVYNYAHLPERFKAQRLIAVEDLPDPATRLEILAMTIERLTAAGYEYIGMDHFALPDDELCRARQDGTLQRNFQGYSTRRQATMIGLGVSAIGRVDDAYAQNVVTTACYQAMLEAGKLAVVKGLALDFDDRVRAAVIHDIMCRGEVKYAEIGQRFGIGFEHYFAALLAEIQRLAEDGLLNATADEFRVSERGRLLLRPIAAVFDRYLQQEAMTRAYSRAI